MRRRAFLAHTGRIAAAFSFVSLNVRSDQTNIAAQWQLIVADLEKEIERLLTDTIVPGLSIAVIKEAKLVWSRGFGLRDNASKEAVEKDTIFEAGSMSKPVFAYAVMKLSEKGVLNLDKPLADYYAPERVRNGDKRLKVITARHVLCHTSGLENWEPEQEPLKLEFTPGEKWLYSGEGYSYLQSVVTHLTGQPIDQFMKASLFSPFGMGCSGFVWNELFERKAAKPHDSNGKPFAKDKPTPISAARYGVAGGLQTTPKDYAKFLIELIDPKPSDSFRLKKSTVTEMLQPRIKTNDEFGSSWALGWQVEQSGIVHHGGYNKGFVSHAVFSPKTRSSFVVMTNGENGGKVIKSLLLGEITHRLVETA